MQGLLFVLFLAAALCAVFPRSLAALGVGALIVARNLLPADLRMPLALFSVSNNTVDAELKVEVILDSFLEALVEDLLPLTAFSTDFSSALIDEGDTVTLGYIPAAAAARTFEGTYTIQASDYQKKKLPCDQHEYVSWGLSDVDLYKGSLVNLQNQARMKGHALASKVLANILGVVTNAKFGAPVLNIAHGNFDLDEVADLRTAARKAKWPRGMRNLILGADYYGNVVKGSVFQKANESGTDTRATGELPNLYSFNMFESESIPENGENLEGFMCMNSAIGVVMRYLKPRRPERYIDARAVSHKPTGITFGFRQDYDTKTGVEAYIFESNFGKDVLESEALKRITRP